MGKHGFQKGSSADNPDRRSSKKDTSKRDRSTIMRLKMYRDTAKYSRDGSRLVRGTYMTPTQSGGQKIDGMARIAPNRKWFGNTRVVGSKELDTFREELGKQVRDPYQVVLRAKKLPMGLLVDKQKVERANLLAARGFEDVFGPKATRKRPALRAGDLEELVQEASGSTGDYSREGDSSIVRAAAGEGELVREKVFDKGQSKRIWGELYKVLDCSDVVLQVIDARDPEGTRSRAVERHLAKNARHKHLVLVLNKCDLVPPWVTRRWVKDLSQEYPTLAFHASITNPFGKGALIQLLRQFARLHPEKKQISVGLVGYPNVGKSSVINALRRKRVCHVAPVPGETKVWQYITLMRRINLIDCPGIVRPSEDTEEDIVLKGVVRCERLETPEDYVPGVLRRVRREFLQRSYELEDWTDAEDFLAQVRWRPRGLVAPSPAAVWALPRSPDSPPPDCPCPSPPPQIARKKGKLLKGGEPDVRIAARIVLSDWQRGRLPYYVPPSASSQEEAGAAGRSASDATGPELSLGKSDGRSGAPIRQNFGSLPTRDVYHEETGEGVVAAVEEEGEDADEEEGGEAGEDGAAGQRKRRRGEEAAPEGGEAECDPDTARALLLDVFDGRGQADAGGKAAAASGDGKKPRTKQGRKRARRRATDQRIRAEEKGAQFDDLEM